VGADVPAEGDPGPALKVREGQYIVDGRPITDVQWGGRGLSWELGVRAYRYLVTERKGDWPPGLEEWEQLCE
jgi:hypothetical protein